MRKISKEAAEAFKNDYKFTKSNTKVRVANGETTLLLHDNCIARKVSDDQNQKVQLYISDGGYPMSITTKDRLNALEGVQVHTSNFVDFLNGVEWNGEETLI